jgi:predicted RNA-binding Zn-ribbon protein involved in translation (DUF1610 family)
MEEWLRRHRLVKSTSDMDHELLAEVFRASAAKFHCPHCGRDGLTASPSRELSDSEWGQAQVCENCGAPIPRERLEVFPAATLCVGCQARDDRGEPTGQAEYCPRCGAIMTLVQSRAAGITRYVMVCPTCRR